MKLDSPFSFERVERRDLVRDRRGGSDDLATLVTLLAAAAPSAPATSAATGSGRLLARHL